MDPKSGIDADLLIKKACLWMVTTMNKTNSWGLLTAILPTLTAGMWLEEVLEGDLLAMSTPLGQRIGFYGCPYTV